MRIVFKQRRAVKFTDEATLQKIVEETGVPRPYEFRDSHDDKGRSVYTSQLPKNVDLGTARVVSDAKEIFVKWLQWSNGRGVGVTFAKSLSSQDIDRLLKMAYNILKCETSLRTVNLWKHGYFGIWASPSTMYKGVEVHPYFKTYLTTAIRQPGWPNRPVRYLWVIKPDVVRYDPFSIPIIATAVIAHWLCRNAERGIVTEKDATPSELIYSALMVWNPGYGSAKFDYLFK